jgi:hypothetical protein
MSRYGDHSFSRCSPYLWNGLPLDLRTLEGMDKGICLPKNLWGSGALRMGNHGKVPYNLIDCLIDKLPQFLFPIVI